MLLISDQPHTLVERVIGEESWRGLALRPHEVAQAVERLRSIHRLSARGKTAEFEHDLPDFTLHDSDAPPCSLVVLDLDGFKSINDRLGHLAGNRVLKACPELLLQACDGKGTVYRNGGDEFCVLPNHSLEEATAVAERILREACLIRTEELPNGLSVSIGAASFR